MEAITKLSWLVEKTYTHYIVVEAEDEDLAMEKADAVPLEKWDEQKLEDGHVKKLRTSTMIK